MQPKSSKRDDSTHARRMRDIRRLIECFFGDEGVEATVRIISRRRHSRRPPKGSPNPDA